MSDNTIRACSYNVRVDVESDGEFTWDRRREGVTDTLRFQRPDLIGLQEPLAHQYDDVRSALGEFEWVGRARQASGSTNEYCPIGYRSERFDRLDSGTFWLSETPDNPGSRGWDAAIPRIVTWVRLREAATGNCLLYCNTHFDHEGERARRESARLLVEWVTANRDGDPAIVAGDFNCTPSGRPYRTLAGEAAVDSPLAPAEAVAPRSRYGPSTTRTDFESLLPGQEIDHAFVVGLAVEQCGTVSNQLGDGWYPSDHLPLVVDLDLAPDGTAGTGTSG